MKEVVGVVPTLHLREALQGRRRVRAADTVLALLSEEPDVGRCRDSTGESEAPEFPTGWLDSRCQSRSTCSDGQHDLSVQVGP